MRYNVAQLLQENVGATRQYELDEPPRALDKGVEARAPLKGTIQLTRTNRGVVVNAKIATELSVTCSRCLEDAAAPVTLSILEEFYPTVDLRTGQPFKIPEGGTGFMLTDAHELDLTEPVRQAMVLEQPMKPLCRPDCPGLCPQCGHNLNEGPCGCADEPGDRRLATLAEWLRANQLH